MGLFLCFLRNTLFESSALLKPVTLTSPHFSSNDLAFEFTRAWKDSRESTSSLTWKIHLPSSLRHPPSQAPQGPLSLLWPTSIYCSPNPSRWPFKWTQVSQISKPIKTKNSLSSLWFSSATDIFTLTLTAELPESAVYLLSLHSLSCSLLNPLPLPPPAPIFFFLLTLVGNPLNRKKTSPFICIIISNGRKILVITALYYTTLYNIITILYCTIL